MANKSHSNMGAPNSGAPQSRTVQTASSGMTREEHMKKLSNDPQFKVLKPSGKGFVIGGARKPEKPD